MAGKLYGLDELLLFHYTKTAFDVWRVNTNIGRSIVLTAVKQVIKDKASDLHQYTKEQAKNLYHYTKIKARKGYDHAKAHARAHIRQLAIRVKDKIEDAYNNRFNITSIRKRLFAITDSQENDNNNNIIDNNNDDDIDNTAINASNDNIINDKELTTEMKEKKEVARKARLMASIRHAKAKAKSTKSSKNNI